MNKYKKQKWNLRKIICYMTYLLIAKHLPDEFGVLGDISNRLRRAVTRPLLLECGKKFGIASGVNYGNGSRLIMREHANIGKDSLIGSGGGVITIGKHVMMGNQCIIIAQNHRYSEKSFDGEEKKDVFIGDYSWLGHRVIVLPGVRIGRYAIIGAGAVVTKNIPDFAIAAGNPAKIIKYRNKKEG